MLKIFFMQFFMYTFSIFLINCLIIYFYHFSACHRWYDVSRSSIVWSKLDVKVKNSVHMLKSILVLPPSVIHLNINCSTFDRLYPLWLPDILTRLHERCPGIKTLIIENVFFSKRFCNAKTTTDHVLLHSFETATSGIKRKRCLQECCSEKISCDKYVPKNRPRELSIFSLRYAHSFLSHLSSQISQFLPSVKVLDLTCSANVKPMAIPFFLKLQCLKELYLVECTVSNSALETLLKHIKSLKVLDLEGSHETDDDTFMVLQKHGHFLEQLFLGNTCIESFLIKDGSFPNLQRICFKNTSIDDEEISYFIAKMPKLKYIDASFCNFLLLQIMTLEAVAYEKKFMYSNTGSPTAPCHHFKKKYM